MPSRKTTDHFDLLPYIAILMCTLGTLLLMTLSMTAINLGPAAGVGIVPTVGTNRQAKLPILVEWDGRTVNVHRGQKLDAIATDDDPKIGLEKGQLTLIYDDKLNPVLDELAQRSNTHYALFVLRPSGFSNFMSLRARFERRGLPIGYEPFEQDRPVRLIEKQVGLTNATPPL